MPRPKPDNIVRHQIVFGEADRKILASAVDSYNFNTIMGNFTKVLNDVTGTITLLVLIGASGLLGLVFFFNVNPVHLASGNFSAIFRDFNIQYNQAYQRSSEEKKAAADKRRQELEAKYAGDPLGYVADVTSNPVIKIADLLFGKDTVAGSILSDAASVTNQNFGPSSSGATYEDGELKFN